MKTLEAKTLEAKTLEAKTLEAKTLDILTKGNTPEVRMSFFCFDIGLNL